MNTQKTHNTQTFRSIQIMQHICSSIVDARPPFLTRQISSSNKHVILFGKNAMIDFDVLNWNQRLDQISCERQLLNANIWTEEYCIWLHLIIGDYSQNHLEENGIPICNAIISFYDSVRRASSKKYQGNTFADKCIEYDK